MRAWNRELTGLRLGMVVFMREREAMQYKPTDVGHFGGAGYNVRKQ